MKKERMLFACIAMTVMAGTSVADQGSSRINELALKTRYYRTRPITSPGYEAEVFRLDPKKTALVVLHLWDIGGEGGPPINPDFFVGMGMAETTREAGRIIKEVIKPVVDAARRAGLYVCHVTHEWIAKRDPRAQKYLGSDATKPASITISPGSEPRGYEAVPGWRKKINERAYGKDFLTESPLATMNESRLIEILPGEPYLFQTDELLRLLKEKGIENIIYAGFATDMCVLRADGGIEPMAAESYRVFLMRDATIGVEFPDTFKERRSTEYAVRFFEVHFGNTLVAADFIKACDGIK